MEVKGVAFVARKKTLITLFGEEKFNDFMREVGEKEEYFKNTSINQMTMIPIEKFLLLQEMMIAKFYGGDVHAYWIMGEKSAEFALSEGPYKILVKNHNIEYVCKNSIPGLWNMYYNKGTVETKYEPGTVLIRIFNLPINHYYFEYVVMGYFSKVLELSGAKSIKYDKIKTIDRGDKEIEYRFHFHA